MHMTAGELGLDPTAVRQRGASMSSGVDRMTDVSLEVFSTCVQSSDGDPETYVQRVVDVARWCEQAGSKEIDVYCDNQLFYPWLVSHIIIHNTTSMCPFVK